LDSVGTGAEDDKDLLNKFLETRIGNRVSGTEGRVRNWRKQNSGKSASNGNHVTALDTVTHREHLGLVSLLRNACRLEPYPTWF